MCDEWFTEADQNSASLTFLENNLVVLEGPMEISLWTTVHHQLYSIHGGETIDGESSLIFILFYL